MDLSIIIVNWNTKDLLAQCLSSIFQDFSTLSAEDPPLPRLGPALSLRPEPQAEGKVEGVGPALRVVEGPALSEIEGAEVFVVDNASTDGSAQMVRARFPQVRLIANQENVGFACANNQAIRHSKGYYVLLLNSDTIIHPGTTEIMADFLNRHPDVGILGPCLLNPDGSAQSSWADFPTLLSELLGRDFHRRRKRLIDGTTMAYYVDAVSGACMMVRRKALDEVGLLDETYFMYSEEVDWCYRMHQAGWFVVHLPAAKVTHVIGGSSRQNPVACKVELYRSKIHFFRKHYGFFDAQRLRNSVVQIQLVKGLLLRTLGRILGNASLIDRSDDLQRIASVIANLRLD